MLRRTLIVGGIMALMVGPVAMAQQTTQPVPPAQAGAIAATMQLRQNAFRLTILNSLPEEARAEATALMDRKQALQTAEQELELTRLQAYVTALEAGESPKVAQDLATGKVAAQSADVTREREALRTDAEAFEGTWWFHERARLVTELAAGCTLTAARKLRADGRIPEGASVALIVCGANVSLATLCDYLARFGGHGTASGERAGLPDAATVSARPQT